MSIVKFSLFLLSALLLIGSAQAKCCRLYPDPRVTVDAPGDGATTKTMTCPGAIPKAKKFILELASASQAVFTIVPPDSFKVVVEATGVEDAKAIMGGLCCEGDGAGEKKIWPICG